MFSGRANDSAGLEVVLDGLPTPLVLLEPGTGRLLFANRAADRNGGGESLPSAMARVAGDVPAPLAWRDQAWLVTAQPLEAPGYGSVLAVTAQDVTELEAERRRSEAIADATAALARTDGFDETLRTMARLLVPRLADWCFVELVRSDGSIERRVIEAADPEKLAAAREYSERWPLDPESPVGSPAVIRSGRPELVEELPVELFEAAAQDEDHLRVLKELGFRSAMIVPLRMGERVVGDLALAMAESGRRFGKEDLRLATALADRCSLFLTERSIRDELEAILEGVADAVFAQDPTGAVVFVNRAGVDLLGFESPEEVVAAPVQDLRARLQFLREDRSPLAVSDHPGQRSLAGETPAPITVRYRRGSTGEERWARLTAQPLLDTDGGVRLAISVLQDITELKQAEYAQRFLAEASQLLAGSLDYEATLSRVAELAVPEIADWCAIDLATADGFERVATRHVDPEKLAFAEELARRYPDEPREDRGVLKVLRTGEAELFPVIPDELLVESARDEEHLRLIRSVGLVSAMIVPMRVRDQVLGAITMVSAESGRQFAPHDLELARDLGVRAATAVENARLYGQRAAIAQTLQSSLLPPELPQIERLECAAMFRAAGAGHEVGGDFYDLFSTDDRTWFAVIGDVCGKGAEAAATTALVRYTVRAAAARRQSPAEVLRWVNDAMLRQQDPYKRFATVAVVRLDVGGDAVRATSASGGHPLPRIVRADGTVEALGAAGTLVGVTPDVVLVEASATLEDGDSLVLFTDGLTEAAAPKRMWTPDDLHRALHEAGAGAGGSLSRLVEQVAAAALGSADADPRDDVALLALRAR